MDADRVTLRALVQWALARLVRAATRGVRGFSVQIPPHPRTS